MEDAPILMVQSKVAKTLTATVPITVKNFVNVVAVRMKIKYDATMMSIEGTPKLNVMGAMTAINKSVPGELVVSALVWPGKYFTQLDGKPFTDGATLLSIVFKKKTNGTSKIYFLDDQMGNACSMRIDILDASGKPVIANSKPLTNQLTDDAPTEEHYFSGTLTFES